LVGLLLKSEKESSENGASEAADKSSIGGLDGALWHCAPVVRYSVKRLVRGLASSRKGARQGFALALTAVLGQLDELKSAATVSALIESLPETSAGGNRDDILGHLFAVGAVVRSGVELDVPTATAVVEQAVGLAFKKSFLREAACRFPVPVNISQ